jgi:hypothetical protein
MTILRALPKLVTPTDARRPSLAVASLTTEAIPNEEVSMYVVAQHIIKDAETAFARGQSLIKGEGAPSGVRVLQFYPSIDDAAVTCLWEAESVRDVRQYVDSTLGDSSENTCYEADADRAFAERPIGLPASPAIAA